MNKKIREEKITKIEIAQRELSESIMLFFEGRDPVTYNLLGHASHEIITNIANARGINSIVRDDMESMINESGLDNVLTARYGKEYKPKKMNIHKKIRFFVDIEYNKIKHGGGDAKEEVTIHWDTVQILILDSIEMLKGLGVPLSSEHIAFMLWVKKEAPEVYNSTAMFEALNYFEKNIGKINKQNLLDFIRDFKRFGFEEFLQKNWRGERDSNPQPLQ